MKLLLVDGLSVVRRVYEATPGPDSVERAEGAFANSWHSFRRALNEHSPSHCLAAFDFGGHTWRHDLYARYRETREPMPQVLRDGLPRFYENLSGLGLKVVSVPGVEAEDVIATAFFRWTREGRGESVVITGDKDLYGLIAHGAVIRDHFKNEFRDRAWVEAKFGVPPELLWDFLALTGDAVDAIPGVSGVGNKTAAKLLREYGSLDNVVAHAGSLTGKVGANLVAEADLARLSRELVALKTDVPLGVTWRMLLCSHGARSDERNYV